MTLEARLQAAMTQVIQEYPAERFSPSAKQALLDMARNSAPNPALRIPRDILDEERAVALAKTAEGGSLAAGQAGREASALVGAGSNQVVEGAGAGGQEDSGN